jgi:hypothetical protein
MSKKTTYIVHYKYEVDATNTTEYSHYLIDAVDKNVRFAECPVSNFDTITRM